MTDKTMSEKSPDRSATSNGSHTSFEAMMTTDYLVPDLHEDYSTYQETYHETSIFTDFNGPPELVAEEMEDFSSDGESTLDSESSSDTEENEGDEGNFANDSDHEVITHNSPELGATTAHLDGAAVPSMPLAGDRNDNPTSFASLLDSPYAPTRGSFDVEVSLKEHEAEVEYLKTEKRRIKMLLKEAEERCQETRQKLESSNKAFKALQDHNGISEELWREYEAFCESLESPFGCRGGWSVTCFADHKNSYVTYDPDLRLFTESAEFPLGLQGCNFRCEAYTAAVVPSSKPRLAPDCPPTEHEYVVEFWPVASPVPRTGTETTWEEQYPDLYRLATRALYDLTRTDTQAASDLLKSLPDPKATFSGGWLFEYQSEKKRASHPILSRRWVYRSAHRISDLGLEFDEEDPITDADAAEDTDSDQEGEVAAENFDANMLFRFSHQREVEEEMDLDLN